MAKRPMNIMKWILREPTIAESLTVASSLIVLGSLVFFLSCKLILLPTHDLAKSLSMLFGLAMVLTGWLNIGVELDRKGYYSWCFLYSIISSVIALVVSWFSTDVIHWYDYILAIFGFIILSLSFFTLFVVINKLWGEPNKDTSLENDSERIEDNG